MAGYIGSKASVTQVDGYNRTEADARYANITGDTFTGAITGTDLTLSGGVYLGGTGAANLLDDYEEGTWTPVFVQTGSNPAIAYSGQYGLYTKIGRMVNVSCRVATASVSGAGGGAISVGGLPFSPTQSTDIFAAALSPSFAGWSATNAPKAGFCSAGVGGRILLKGADSSDARSEFDTDITSFGDGSVGVLLSLTYYTS